jgi:rod shape-determining protein MreD
LLILAQVILNRYVSITKINPDLLFLILVYISIQSGVLKTVIWATIIGWITDFFTFGLVGVFGFSRVLTAFLLHEFYKFFDLRRRFFVFLLIFVSLSFSNLIANLFFYFIYGEGIHLSLIFRQPFFSALIGTLIISSSKIKESLDVH